MSELLQLVNRVVNLGTIQRAKITRTDCGDFSEFELEVEHEGGAKERFHNYAARRVRDALKPLLVEIEETQRANLLIDAPPPCFARPAQAESDKPAGSASPSPMLPRFVLLHSRKRVVNVSKMAIVAKTKTMGTRFAITVTWTDGAKEGFHDNDARAIWICFGMRSLKLGEYRVNVAEAASAAKDFDDAGLPVARLGWGAGFTKDFSGDHGERILEAASEGALDVRDMAHGERRPG